MCTYYVLKNIINKKYLIILRSIIVTDNNDKDVQLIYELFITITEILNLSQ